MIRGQRTAPNDSTVGIMPNPRHLQRALIVEDLDEPRQWLAELLPEALTGIVHVDTAASLASARALTQHNSYDLALVDWGLRCDGSAPGDRAGRASAVPVSRPSGIEAFSRITAGQSCSKRS